MIGPDTPSKELNTAFPSSSGRYRTKKLGETDSTVICGEIS